MEKKDGRPSKKTTGFEKEKTIGFEEKKPTVLKKKENKKPNVNVNVNENENLKENNIKEKSPEKKTTVKANKHKHGKYQNVLLKDEELQSLKNDFSNWEDLIEYLDEYIEMKGYKAKSHYLCIRKWVVDAVKRNNPKKDYEQRDYGDLSFLYANKGE